MAPATWTKFSIEDIIYAPTDDSTNFFQLFIVPSSTPILFDDFDIHPQPAAGVRSGFHVLPENAMRLNSGVVSFVNQTHYSCRLLTISGQQLLHENGYGKSIDFLEKGIHPGFYLIKGTSDAGEFSGDMLIGNRTK